MLRLLVTAVGFMLPLLLASFPVAAGAGGVLTGATLHREAASATVEARSARTVVVKGHVWKKSGKVRLERRSGHHWRLVRHVTVRHHRFSARVKQRTATARYRARLGHRHSRIFVVRLHPSERASTHPTAPVSHAPPSTPPGPGAPILGVVHTVGDVVGGVIGSVGSVVTGVLNPPGPSSPPPSDACGIRPPKADGSFWSCTFHDEFTGTTLDRTKWMPQTNFTSGTAAAHACYLDDPDNISVSDGTLNLTVRNENPPVPCQNRSLGATSPYSGGSVMTYRLFSQQYGRFEARARVTAATQPGLQETFWLWPDDRVASNVLWPAAGEIDIAETYSQYPALAIPFLHYKANDNITARPGLNTAWTCHAQRGVYNTYTLEWSANRIEIDVNGEQCLVNTSGDPAFQKPYIIALSAMLGVGANALTDQTPLPATTSVDYVRVWN